MRLLLQGETGEFSLREFSDDNIPRYAILSHTWLAAHEEPTYDDLRKGTGKEKPGYKKIRFCGEQAKRDDLQYFWVDTCCINKANYAELQYALDSMFRWYHNADRCYVYLSDVSSPPLSTNAEFHTSSWDSEFWKSRWFTRGWTLQELLAPRRVEFFSCEGKHLGDKNSLTQQIHKITNIPIPALEGAPLFQFSVNERLLWMERRQTTLEIDRVYALLGILDVKIPLFQDINAPTAFEQLREIIDKREKCIKDLHITDPRDDKKRIENTKGGLLKDSYHWILENCEFEQWYSIQQNPLLWIKGDPGKGKTMLLCGIINELDKPIHKTALLSYFFCQATDSRINNATAVLRGLIYMLVTQQPSLVSHIQKKHDHAGKALFEDLNAWVALSEIFTDILQDSSLNTAYLVIDALDECVAGLPKLLDFIVRNSSKAPHVKWIVSSRNWPEIGEGLEMAAQKVTLQLELNSKSISTAVSIYIRYKVDNLARQNKYRPETKQIVFDHLSLYADDTFLWVALVSQDLENVKERNVKKKLNAYPLGLDPLYQNMMKKTLDSEDADYCKQVLATATLVHQPVTLIELASLIKMPDISIDELREIVLLCGSFLTIRENTEIIYFVHQSAKDFLLKDKEALNEIFPSGKGVIHHDIFLRSLEVMSSTLRQDIYSLRAPGFPIDQVKQPDPDPLAVAQYSCLYWIEHLIDCDIKGDSADDLKDGGLVHDFLQKNYLYWLEALSLIKSLPNGIRMIMKFENLQAFDNPNLQAFIHDAKRFILYNRPAIELAPLQSYCSALVFSPEKSIVRETFKNCIPPWIQGKPRVQAHWSAALQTLEGHTDYVYSVAFSPDGKQIVSGSGETVRLCEAATGAVLQTLEGHTDSVYSVAFSPDGKQIVSRSEDSTVRLWDAATGAVLQTLEGHTSSVSSVAFSPDGKQIMSGSEDSTVRLWDTATGAVLQTLEGHTDSVYSVAFSPDGKQIVSGSWDKTVRLWDAATGAILQTLEGHTSYVYSVAFSPDGKQIVSGSWDKTVRLWDTATGAVLQILEGHTSYINSVAFSPDSKQIVSGSGDNTVRLWDAATGAILQIFKGHMDSVYSVAFSPDSKQIVSRSGDNTVRLWDAATGAILQTLEGHTSYVNSVAFSPDGKQIVSGSWDNTVRLWDAATGAVLQILEGHTSYVNSVAFSPDGNMLPTLHTSDCWIAEGEANILWLPPDYRSTCDAVWDNTVVLGHSSGRVSFFQFREGPKLIE